MLLKWLICWRNSKTFQPIWVLKPPRDWPFSNMEWICSVIKDCSLCNQHTSSFCFERRIHCFHLQGDLSALLLWLSFHNMYKMLERWLPIRKECCFQRNERTMSETLILTITKLNLHKPISQKSSVRYLSIYFSTLLVNISIQGERVKSLYSLLAYVCLLKGL